MKNSNVARGILSLLLDCQDDFDYNMEIKFQSNYYAKNDKFTYLDYENNKCEILIEDGNIVFENEPIEFDELEKLIKGE